MKNIKTKKIVVSFLAVMVVLLTIYSLHLPAVALTKNEAQEDPSVTLNNNTEETVDTTETTLNEGESEDSTLSETPVTTFQGQSEESIVYVEAPEGAFPEGTEMKIEEVAATDEIKAVIENSDVISNDQVITDIKAVDVSFYDKDENKQEPEGTVKVSISASYMEDINSGKAILVHIKDDGTVEEIKTKDITVKDIETVAEATKEEVKNNDNIDEINTTNTVSFETDSFSTYAVVYTVDFYYGDYEYHLEGGKEIYLDQLFSVLGIDVNLTDVKDVEFSNYDLVNVYQVEGNWILESKKAFDTVEKLTVFLNNGQEIEIRVEDEIDLNNDNDQLSASLTSNTSVSYNPDQEAYSANFTMKFVVSKEKILADTEHKLVYTLGDDVRIPDNALNVTYTAIDHGAGMESFDYQFVKGNDGKYYINIVFRDDYLNNVDRIGKNTLSFNALIGREAQKDNENLHIDFAKDVTIDIPLKDITYPDYDDGKNDIKADKSYLGYGTTSDGKTYLDYSVTVKSNKGTSDKVLLKDKLNSLTYKINNIEQNLEVTSINIIDIKKNGTEIEIDDSSFVPDTSSKSFSYSLPKFGENDTYIVTYRYVLDKAIQESGEDGSDFSMVASGNNTIEAKSGTIKSTDSDGFNIEKSNREVTISKSGKYTDNSIEWVINLDIKSGSHDLIDEMFSYASDIVVEPSAGVTVDKTNNKIHFNNAGTYKITYKTSVESELYENKNVYNIAKVDGRDDQNWKAETTVTVPYSGKDLLDKSLIDERLVNTEGSIREYLLTWNITFDLPQDGFKSGTQLSDTLVFSRNYLQTNNKHILTEIQKNELISKLESIFGSGVFTVEFNNTDSQCELKLTFNQDWGNPENLLSANISYETTAYADMDTISLGLSTQSSKDYFKNTFKINDVTVDAQFTFSNEVNKIDPDYRDGKNNTSHKITRDNNKVSWAIVLDLTDDYYTFNIKDELPAGLSITDIGIGGEYTYDIFEKQENNSFVPKSSNQYTGDTVESISLDGQELTIALKVKDDNSNRKEFLKNGNKLFIFVNTIVNESEFGSSTNSKSYTNSVTFSGDGFLVGDANHTQNITLETNSLSKEVVNTRWENYHEIIYRVYINKEGIALVLDEHGQPVPNAKYSLDDVLSFNKLSPDGKEINVMLVPGSVKLKQRDADGQYTADVTGWTYQYNETKDQNIRYKTISVSNIPDSTPLMLEYAYRIDLADTQQGVSYSLGSLNNTATIYGSHEYSIENITEKNWSEFDTHASSESSNSLVLSKVDVSNYNKLLPGSKFVLEKWFDGNWIIVDAISENENAFVTTDTIDGEVRKVYITSSSTNSNAYGTIKIFQPDEEDSSFSHFEYDVCYRVREYSAPDGYLVSNDPEKQPAGYFWFSKNKNKEQVSWPSVRIKQLADDLSIESDTFYITNAKHASLKINKKFVGSFELTDEQKKSIYFEVYDGSNKIAELSYSQILSNNNVISDDRIVEGKTYTVVEKGADIFGSIRTTTYSVNSGDDTVDQDEVISADVLIENGIGTVMFTNKYEDIPDGRIIVNKKWDDAIQSDLVPISVELWAYDQTDTSDYLNVYLVKDWNKASYTNPDITTIIKVPKYGNIKLHNNGSYDLNEINVVDDDNHLVKYSCKKDSDAVIENITGTLYILDGQKFLSATFEKEAINTDSAYRSAVLSNSNDWHCEFNNLPVGYIYKVIESTHLDNFDTYYEYTDDEGNSYSGSTAQKDSMTHAISGGQINIVNKKNTSSSTDIYIFKDDKDNSLIHLSGAIFSIYGLNPDEVGEVHISETPIQEITTNGEEGKASFTNIANGYYVIKEVSPPIGYILNNDVCIYIQVSNGVVNRLEKSDELKPTEWSSKTNDDFVKIKNANSFLIHNISGKQLPMTGGIGTPIYIYLGSSLIVLSLLLLKKKKQFKALRKGGN